LKRPGELVLSHEHKEIGLFAKHEIAELNMPDGYQHSIMTWFARLSGGVR
jgi:hypothetical protein